MYANLGSLKSRDRDSGNQKPGRNGHFCSVNFTYTRAFWVLLRGGGGSTRRLASNLRFVCSKNDLFKWHGKKPV